MSILRGIIGISALIFLTFLVSRNRKKIQWRAVIVGLFIQVVLAIAILKVPFIRDIFDIVGKIFIKVLDFTREGSEFVLGDLMDVDTYGFIFLFQVLPTIIFFSALTSVLFYLGLIQLFVKGLAWLFVKAFKISGAEALSVAGNIFLGQTESPLMIKKYIPKMTDSEILLVMIGGMATIAGGVMAAYISFLGGEDPHQRLFFAKHLLTASVMAAPGAIVVSKILLPQTIEINTATNFSQEKSDNNILEALTSGTSEGIKMAVNVGGMLLVFVAFIAMINYIFLKIGEISTLNSFISEITGDQYSALSLQFLLGYLFAPLMWIIGVPAEDMALAGQLLGEKIIMSEFIAYISLSQIQEAGHFAFQKSTLMSTYMLCGFANVASIGIQIGGIGALAPNKKSILAKYGLMALIGGTLASLLSATIIGMILVR